MQAMSGPLTLMKSLVSILHQSIQSEERLLSEMSTFSDLAVLEKVTCNTRVDDADVELEEVTQLELESQEKYSMLQMKTNAGA
jgi:hypothetical protein